VARIDEKCQRLDALTQIEGFRYRVEVEGGGAPPRAAGFRVGRVPDAST
jgi:hypothetical protein